MPHRVAKVAEVDNDTEDDNIVEEQAPRISSKSGKPLLSDEQRRQIRLQNLEKAKKAKQEKNDITKTLKQSKKELTQLELQKQKEELEAVKQKIEVMNTKPKPKPKKKILIQQEEEDEEEDEEETVGIQPKRTRVKKPIVQEQDVDYSSLVKQSAAEQIRKQLENERIKMAMLSIMPSYRFN